MVEANVIAMHVAESGGEGSPRAAVVFLHGFLELWYSWRYQMQHLVAWGYRCVAPDLCGYGGIMRPEVGAAVPEALPRCLWWWSRRRASEGWCGEEKETRSARVRNGELRVGGGRRREVGKKGGPKVKAEADMGSHVNEWRKREAAGVLWSIRKMLMHTVV